MSVMRLFADPNWDAPFFKKLANNDTAAAPGHQGGIVIPKDLRPYFPALNRAASSTFPTTDARVDAVLMVGKSVVGFTNTRYQFQTWGATRRAESRLTDGLAALRNQANGDDFLVIQRDVESLSRYRLVLIRRTDVADYAEVEKVSGGRRWGVLLGHSPLSAEEYEEVCAEEQAKEAAPFSMFDQAIASVEQTTRRMARSLAFRTQIQSLYSRRCAVCGASVITPEGLSELEAAHIVPRNLSGADDARNGLALCRRHHWAFDRGLFGISPTSRTVVVPQRILAIPENSELGSLSGRAISEAMNPALMAHADALDWHMKTLVSKYQ